MYTGSLKATSTGEDWSETFEVYDDETDDLIDLTGAVIVLQFRDRECYPVIAADTTIVDIGIFTATIPVSEMRSLCPQTYEVGCTLFINDTTRQYLLGTIAVLDRIVS